MDRPSRAGFTRQGRGRCDRAADGHAVRVVAVRREPADLDRFVAALLALALAELDGEPGTVPGDDRPVEQSSGR